MANTPYDQNADDQHDLQHLREAESNPEQTYLDHDEPLESNGDVGESSVDTAGGKAADSVKEAEEAPPDRTGFSARDDINETLGMGYTGKGSKRSKGLAKLYNSNSKLKKRVAIAGAAAGGSAIAGVLVFLALLPLKIESIVRNIETRESAAAVSAMTSEMDNAYTRFVQTKVLPNLGKHGCRTTIDATCVSGTAGKDPVSKMYSAWKQGNIEQKLAQKYNIVIGMKGNQYYMNLDGNAYADASTMDKDLRDVQAGRKSLFDIGPSSGTAKVTRSEIRSSIQDALKDASKWDKVYFRFKLGKLLESKYGIKRCIIACNISDKFANKVADKKLAAKAYLFDRVLGPFGESKALAMTCILAGTCDTTPSELSGDPTDPEHLSPFQRQLQQRLDDFAAKYGSEKLGDLVAKANDISKDGFAKYFAKQIAQAIVDKAGGGDAAKAIASDTAEKFIPIGGWVIFASALVVFIDKAPQELKALNYATSAPAAVSTYMTYRTAADEMQSGHIDPTEFGSLAQQLDNGGVDASSTPLFAQVMGGGKGTSTAFSGLLPSAYADASSTKYLCADGKPVPVGQQVCDEENFSGGNKVVTAISDGFKSIPGWDAISTLAGLIHGPVAQISQFFGDALNLIPGVNEALSAIADLAKPLLGMLSTYLLPNPFADGVTNSTGPAQSSVDGTDKSLPGGGRTFDMIYGGADVAMNKGCQTQLGCSQASPAQTAAVQNEQIAEEKAQFSHMSVFARMFDTSNSNSLISHLALDMPTSTMSASGAGLSTLFSNPVATLGNAFGTIFTDNHAFGDVKPQTDPFGVVQSGYDSSSIPPDPQTYWQQACVNGPMAKYNTDTQTLDLSDWLNNVDYTLVNPTSLVHDGKANTDNDPDTGEQVNLKTNPCLLIQATAQSGGGLFDPSLLPADSANQSATTTSGVTGDAPTLAKQVLSNSNIILQKDCTTGPTVEPSGCAYDDVQAISQGQKVTPGKIEGQNNGTASTGACTARTPVVLDAMLLQAMLNISQKYKIEVEDITSGHDCDSGRHPLGRAMDIFSVNGKAINGHCTDSDIQQFLHDTTNMMSQLEPNGQSAGGRAINMPGIGSCNPAEDGTHPSWVPANVNYFFDSTDEIHVDTGFAG